MSSGPGFQLVLLTAPEPHPAEIKVLAAIMASPTPPRLHLRRPAWTPAETAAWLRAAPPEWLPHLVLHNHHVLAAEFRVGGVHFTASARAAGQHQVRPASGTVSTALHSLAEVQALGPAFDYVFLSPIFNSISKVGYPSAFELPEVAATLQAVPEARVLALGGIQAGTLPLAQQTGFAGAAVLGAVWEAPDPVAAFRELADLAYGKQL
ncbi:thiamine phosphate synthase [Hymenobacter sediminis]|uniref:thiamine phosphate synthase n=1 Tax=Hymenobacter sediminis TaxID=2218621 RepID=UPI000DA6B574|nr:thiamine phosphate synthase [Hymenobacter sediminis]RPD49552.1 thiamine phosphate synthase [Hymenobacter sediminis]